MLRKSFLTTSVIMTGAMTAYSYKTRAKNSNDTFIYSHCNSDSNAVDTAHKWPFDTKGVPTRINQPNIPQLITKQSSPLFLVGIGMRRKYLYVVDVDVYLVGVGLSASALSSATEWSVNKNRTSSSYQTLSSLVLKQSTNSPGNQVQVATILRFVRAVNKQQFIDAFREAFAGVDAKDFDEFKEMLDKALGDKIDNNDEVTFYWLSEGELVASKNGKVLAIIKNRAIASRLLDVYTDPERAVSKDLMECMDKNFNSVVDLSKGKSESSLSSRRQNDELRNRT